MKKAVKLTQKTVLKVTPVAPFNFDATFHKPSHFPSKDNEWKPGVRWQTFRWLNKILGVVFKEVKQDLHLEIHSKKKLSKELLDSLVEEISYRYNLNLDLSEFYRLSKTDKLLSSIIEKYYGMRPGHENSLYEYIIIGIVLQNATVKRSIQMMQTLFEKHGTLLEFNDKKLWCFWEPGSLGSTSEEELRALKLGYRAKFIKRVDKQFEKGLIDEIDLRSKSLDDQKEALMKLYGIGPATAGYLLFDVFHHWDYFVHISPWEQKIYSKLFFNQDPENPVPVEKLLKYLEKFGKYKQLAVHYIWEGIFWKRKNENIPWLEKLIRV